MTVTIRVATILDADLLFRWRNDPATIASLPNPRPVDENAHGAWVGHRVNSPHFYIAEDEGNPIGTGRLEARYEIAVLVAPECRGRDYATPLIAQVTARADAPVLARIAPGNHASIRAFLKAGFHRDPFVWFTP